MRKGKLLVGHIKQSMTYLFNKKTNKLKISLPTLDLCSIHLHHIYIHDALKIHETTYHLVSQHEHV